MLFLEDASLADNQQSYEIIRQHTTIPLAIGETYNTLWDCKYLIEKERGRKKGAGQRKSPDTFNGDYENEPL